MSLYFDAITMAGNYDDKVMIQEADDSSGYITQVTGNTCYDQSLHVSGLQNPRSTTNSVRVTFLSDFTSTYSGFALRWGK